jgi:hypothetical protein
MFRLKKENHDAELETIMTYAPMPGTELWSLAVEHGLKEPEKFEDWINWRFDEYDDSGTRNPWYNSHERRMLGNICYLLEISNIVPNLLKGNNGILSKAIGVLAKFPSAWAEWRIRNKLYQFAPELEIVKFLREVIYYK